MEWAPPRGSADARGVGIDPKAFEAGRGPPFVVRCGAPLLRERDDACEETAGDSARLAYCCISGDSRPPPPFDEACIRLEEARVRTGDTFRAL